MFYDPCIAAINGIVNSDTDPQYLIAETWYNHPECSHIACLANNMTWDRENGGCKPGIVTSTSEVEDPATDPKCSKKLDEDGKTESCTHYTEEKNLQIIIICMATE